MRVFRIPNSQNRWASTAAYWNRTDQIETEDYIHGDVALFDQQQRGIGDVVLLEVTLDGHDDDALARFGTDHATLPNVLEAYPVSGAYDYLVKIAVNGTAVYERFPRGKRHRLSGVRLSRSRFAQRWMKSIPSVQI